MQRQIVESRIDSAIVVKSGFVGRCTKRQRDVASSKASRREIEVVMICDDSR